MLDRRRAILLGTFVVLIAGAAVAGSIGREERRLRAELRALEDGLAADGLPVAADALFPAPGPGDGAEALRAAGQRLLALPEDASSAVADAPDKFLAPERWAARATAPRPTPRSSAARRRPTRCSPRGSVDAIRASRLPPAEATQALIAVFDASGGRAPRSGVAATLLEPLLPFHAKWRLGLAHVRLVKAALEPGEPLPADPFAPGRRLGRRVEGTRVTLWSVGEDGRDDGARGPRGDETSSPDVVLELDDR